MITRRQALGAALSALPLAACERAWSGVARELGQRIPPRVRVGSSEEIDPIFQLLSRAGHGAWPGELERAQEMGRDGWIEEQLAPSTIDDTACDVRARRFETIHLDPRLCYEFDKRVLREEIERHTLLHAVYSKRQLFEVMVGFWTDHFNVDANKGDVLYFLPASDRAIREHALGSFRDLVRASVTSGAMLLYLDGASSGRRAPNENHARELLELHTLGVRGGYTQADVRELARAMTGWRVRTQGWGRGRVELDPNEHDDGDRRVLGEVIREGDIERVVDLVSSHPSAARYVCEKLARKFVCDDPPAPLVARAAETFERTRGDIRAVLGVILRSIEMERARGEKLKRPFAFVASALRGLGADTHAHPSEEGEALGRLGQTPFSWPTPDGFPDRGERWTGTILWRWSFAFSLARDPRVDLGALASAIGGPRELFAHLIGRAPDHREAELLRGYQDMRADLPETVALILSSPAFQRC